MGPGFEVVYAYQYDVRSPGQGGGVRYVDRLVRWLAGVGVRVTLLGEEEPVGPVARIPNLRFVPLRRATRPGSPWWRFWLALFVRLINLRLPRTAVVHVQRSYFLLPFVLLRPNTPRVCTLHAQPWEWLDANLPGWRWLLVPARRAIEGYCLRRAHAIIAVGERERRGYVREYPWLDGRILLLPNVVDLSHFRPVADRRLRASWGIGPGERVVLYAGRLARQKDVPLLVEAFSQVERMLPEARLLIAGEGSELAAVRAAQSRSGAQRVTYLGSVPPDRMVELLNIADVLALSSRFEASPFVVREALACGTPVVGPDVGDLRDIITSPLLGRVKERSGDSLAQGILDVLGQDRDEMRGACREAATAFDEGVAMRRLVEIYRNVVAQQVGETTG